MCPSYGVEARHSGTNQGRMWSVARSFAALRMTGTGGGGAQGEKGGMECRGGGEAERRGQQGLKPVLFFVFPGGTVVGMMGV